MKKRVAILGSGNIGTDLLIKIMRSPYLECIAFIGRNLASPGMMKAQSLKIPVFAEGIRYLVQNPTCCDIVFDATSSTAHIEHAPILASLQKFVIDLTPAQVGKMCVPVVDMKVALSENNVNMITCGGQAAMPIVHAIALTHREIDYIEVVSSIASRSAGPATRLNLDEYIHTTEQAIKVYSNAKTTKAILNLNPAQPCIHMQTTIFARVKNPDIEVLRSVVSDIAMKVRQYVSGYNVIVSPILERDRIVVMVRVKGLGDYLPEYAGNLDIINCAALAIAEQYARTKQINFEVKEREYEVYFD